MHFTALIIQTACCCKSWARCRETHPLRDKVQKRLPCFLNFSERSLGAAGSSPSPRLSQWFMYKGLCKCNWSFLQLCSAGLRMATQIYKWFILLTSMTTTRLKDLNQKYLPHAMDSSYKYYSKVHCFLKQCWNSNIKDSKTLIE